MSKRKLCKRPGCYEGRNRDSHRGYCDVHEIEAMQDDAFEYENHPNRVLEASLADCETVEDLKEFIRDHLLPEE